MIRAKTLCASTHVKPPLHERQSAAQAHVINVQWHIQALRRRMDWPIGIYSLKIEFQASLPDMFCVRLWNMSIYNLYINNQYINRHLVKIQLQTTTTERVSLYLIVQIIVDMQLKRYRQALSYDMLLSVRFYVGDNHVNRPFWSVCTCIASQLEVVCWVGGW